MTHMFGYPFKLMIDLDGEPYDATHLVQVTPEGWVVRPDDVLDALYAEQRRRLEKSRGYE